MSFVSETPTKERAWSAGGAALIVALVGWGLISGLKVSPFRQVQQALALIDITAPPPPKPKPEPKIVHQFEKAAKGKPSPRNLKNKATPIVAPPPPPIKLPPPPVIAAPKANVGMAPQTGASNRAGPGQGAGRQGDGYGGGGDGGEGDGDVGPEQTRGKLKLSDLPADLRGGAFTHGTVGVNYAVETDGHVTDCRVTHSSGYADLDAVTCQLIEQRFHFRPAHDANGAPFRAHVVENHTWEIDRTGYEDDRR